jgi:hypothetical protein
MLGNVTANTTVQVTFKVVTYTVTPNAGANGSISPNTALTVNGGGSVSFIATPNTGYTVDKWLVNGSTVQTGGSSYMLGNVTTNTTVQVTFKLVTYTVTPSASANGNINPNTAQSVGSGRNVTFTATPNTGYTVDQWLVNGSAMQTGGTSYTLNNVTTDTTVQVTFKAVTYTVTPSAGANGSISPNTAQSVGSGRNVTFTATPNTGYTVDQWLVNGSAMQAGGTSYTVSNVTTDTTVQVTFKAEVQELQSNVPVKGLADVQDGQKYFKITVPAGQTQLAIAISGGTGDCDLYVKFGSLPTLDDYDYRPLLTGNNESVVVTNPAAGDWFVMLNSYIAYSDLTLVAGVSQQAPTLGVTVRGGKMILSWPANASGFTLQYTTELGSSAIWLAVPTTPTVQNGQDVVEETLTDSSKFYRLKTP